MSANDQIKHLEMETMITIFTYYIMKNTNPILNFRILSEAEPLITEKQYEIHMIINEGHTTITKTREAADSSEHSDTSI